MRDDPELIAKIKVGSIVQIVPEEDHGTPKRLLVVTEIESWGVSGYLQNDLKIARTWNLIEPTGGSIVFDQNGKRVVADKPRFHHP